MIEQVSLETSKIYKSRGILSTTKTKEEQLYDKNLPNVNIIYPNNEEQKAVSEIIIKIIRKESTKEDKAYLEELILCLKQRGAEKIILACTDISNLLRDNMNVIDSTDVLIRAIKKRMMS